MRIVPLSEGSFTVDASKRFVPFDEKKDSLQERPKGSLLVEIQPFLVITQRDMLLLDCGLGFSTGEGALQLHSNLAAQGVKAENITKVLLSHLHKDHAGGILNAEGSAPAFPNARYYVQKKELEAALANAHSSYQADRLEVLRGSADLELLDSGEGEIDGYIRYQMTSAHSKYHQVFWIRENEEQLFFGGDDAPQLQQMKHRYVARYDHDGRRATELRNQWWEQGRKEGWTFLFYHDIAAAVVGR